MIQQIIPTIQNKEDTSKLNNQESNSLENQESSIEFGNLFNEGTIIKFTPKDLEHPKNEEEKEFKKKLIKLEEITKLDGIDVDDLKSLVNDETYFNNESFIDSSWLDYFIKEYHMENYLNDVMNEAISKEDLGAVKTLVLIKTTLSTRKILK